MHDLIRQSKEIYDKAVKDYKPKAIVLMFSGGDDSMATYHVCNELGIKFDYVIHGHTRTGVQETFDFVKKEVDRNNDKLLIADAGDSYVNYVIRKGFIGSGNDAHNIAYHILKVEHFRRVVGTHLRHRRKNYPVLFINGARRLESDRRKITMASPYRIDPNVKSNIWVNVINEFDNHETVDYLEGNEIERNPVSKIICRSGECMCGTMQTEGDRNETSFHFPKWGKWIDQLEKAVLKKFPWKWGENIKKSHHMEMMGQTNLFQPMCVGCKINYGLNNDR